MDAFVEITRPDGSSERFPIEGTQATLGRSGTAGISLPAEPQLELEHILLAPRGKEGCWISASQGAMTPVLVKGKPFQSGILKWGSTLSIGSLKLTVTNKRGATKGASSSSSTSPVLVIVLLVVLAGAAYMLLTDDTAAMPSAEGMEPPSLFAEGPAQCPAGQTGTQLEQFADSRGDRYSYDPRDGVASVNLYKQAAACFAASGAEHTADAQRATRESEQMKATVDADYAARRLRLSRSLATEDWPSVETQSAALLSMTRHLEGNDWRAWLDQVHRIAMARASQAPEAQQ
jgi:hypothetical protein